MTEMYLSHEMLRGINGRINAAVEIVNNASWKPSGWFLSLSIILLNILFLKLLKKYTTL
jgi:hypothetical protein